MQINGKQINDGSIDFDKIVTGDGVVLDVNGSTVTGLPTPVNKSDAVNKAYVDALSSESSYCELVDKVTQLPINSYTKTAGVRVLSTNTSSPGIYEYNAASGKWVKTYDWTMVTSTVPSATLIPSAEDTSVYVAQITSATNVTFAKLPQEQASYVFSNGITALQEGDSTKVSIDYSKVASVSSVTSLANTVNGKQNKLTASNAGDGIKITGNQVIGINQRAQADGGSGAITFTNGKVDIQYASYDQPGIITPEDYTKFNNTAEGVQSNWDENSSSSASYINNRTHYIIPLLLSDSTYTIAKNQNHQYNDITITNGYTYKLTLSNGTQYSAVCVNDVVTFMTDVTLANIGGTVILKNVSNASISVKALYSITEGTVKKLENDYIKYDDDSIIENSDGDLSVANPLTAKQKNWVAKKMAEELQEEFDSKFVVTSTAFNNSYWADEKVSTTQTVEVTCKFNNTNKDASTYTGGWTKKPDCTGVYTIQSSGTVPAATFTLDAFGDYEGCKTTSETVGDWKITTNYPMFYGFVDSNSLTGNQVYAKIKDNRKIATESGSGRNFENNLSTDGYFAILTNGTASMKQSGNTILADYETVSIKINDDITLSKYKLYFTKSSASSGGAYDNVEYSFKI